MNYTQTLAATLKLCELLTAIKQNTKTGDLKWQPTHVNSLVQQILLLDLQSNLSATQKERMDEIIKIYSANHHSTRINKEHVLAELNNCLAENLLLLKNSSPELNRDIERFEINHNLMQLEQNLTNAILTKKSSPPTAILCAFESIKLFKEKSNKYQHISQNKDNIIRFKLKPE